MEQYGGGLGGYGAVSGGKGNPALYQPNDQPDASGYSKVNMLFAAGSGAGGASLVPDGWTQAVADPGGSLIEITWQAVIEPVINVDETLESSRGGPEITQQPQSIEPAAGKRAFFIVEAPDAVAVKWQRQDFGSSAWADIDGANNFYYTIDPVDYSDDEDSFRLSCRAATARRPSRRSRTSACRAAVTSTSSSAGITPSRRQEVPPTMTGCGLPW